MTAQRFLLELRLLARENALWALAGLFAAALAYGAWNGANAAEQRRIAAGEITSDAATFEVELRRYLTSQSVAARDLAGRGGIALLPPAPLPWLAIGQDDLSPAYEHVSLFRLNNPPDARSELENPSHLLAGRIDLAFVLVWLYPLFLLALLYDLMAGDRESGTLRLAVAQGIAPGTWMAQRALARALPMLALAGLAALVASTAGSSGTGALRPALAAVVAVAYGLFWTALAVAVNVSARTSAGAATALGAAWVLLVVVAPTLLNAAVEGLYPTPSRPELVAESRRLSAETEKRGGELLDSFYRDHPELAPASRQADLAAVHLRVQDEVGRAIGPVRRRFEDQLSRQQTVVSRWRFLSPAIAAHEALADLAGTGYWRHRAFREQLAAFKESVAAFYGPKVHRRELITLADINHLPRFTFNEEPAAAWSTRVSAGLAGLGGLACALAAWTWWHLGASRVGRLLD